MTNEEFAAALGEGWAVWEPQRPDVKQTGFAGAKRSVGTWTLEVFVSQVGACFAKVSREIDPDKETLPPFGARAAERARSEGASIRIVECLGSWFLDLDPVATVEQVRSAVSALVEKAITEQECCLRVLRDVQRGL